MRRRRPSVAGAPPLAPLPPEPRPLTPAWRVCLGLCIVVYLAFGIAHALTTPVARDSTQNFINAPDEAAHREYLRALADGGRLPVGPRLLRSDGRQEEVRDNGFPTYEWHQPPLYYWMASVWYRLGPIAVRVFTLLLGLLGIAATYLITRRALPAEPETACLAAGLVALLPMRQAVYASAGNDALLEAAFGFVVLLVFHALRRGLQPVRALAIGTALGCALITKANALLLLPWLLLGLWVFWRAGETPQALARAVLLAGAAAGIVSLWWFARNLQLYGEFTPLAAFKREFEHTARAETFLGQPLRLDSLSGSLTTGPPMDRLDYLWLVANWTFRTFLGAYTSPPRAAIGMPEFMAPGFYLLPALLGAAALYGLLRYVRAHAARDDALQPNMLLMLGALVLLVAASHASFTWVYFQAQGRYLYPALPALAPLAALGLRHAVPERRRNALTIGVLVLMALLCAAFYLVGVRGAYAP